MGPLHIQEHQHWTFVILRCEDYKAYHIDSYHSLGTIIDSEAFHSCRKELNEQ